MNQNTERLSPKGAKSSSERKFMTLPAKYMKTVAYDWLPSDSNIMSGGFLTTVMFLETDQPSFKDPFIIYSNQDNVTNQVVYTSTRIRHSSTTLQIELTSCFEIRVWVQDISWEYI